MGACEDCRDVNLQGKWATFKTEDNGHLEACSNTGKPVDYGLKEGVSHGTADYRKLYEVSERRVCQVLQFHRSVTATGASPMSRLY